MLGEFTQKNVILSSFTYSQVFPNLFEFLSAEHKRRHFKPNIVSFFPIPLKSIEPTTVWFPTFLQISSFGQV